MNEAINALVTAVMFVGVGAIAICNGNLARANGKLLDDSKLRITGRILFWAGVAMMGVGVIVGVLVLGWLSLR